MSAMVSRPVLARRLATWGFLSLGAYQIGLGIYFAAFRPPLLPEDARFIGQPLPPNLESWLDLVFTVMGGQMAALGIALVALAARSYGAASRSRLEVVALALAGVVSAGVMGLVNFGLDSDFKLALLTPVVLWVLAIALATITGRPRPFTSR